MSAPEIEWKRLPGRRWEAVVWRPGEKEAERARYEAWLRAAAPYSQSCPCCGQSMGGFGLGLLGGIGRIFG